MSKEEMPSADNIINSLNDGMYVCDKERRILYWSKSAERITGWASDDVVGHKCLDNILCHIDKDGRKLCSDDFCPLHRSMITDTASTCPVIVFGQAKDGSRIPMVVTVSPVHDSNGEVIGGVESFHDFSETFTDLKRAKRIQTLSLEHDLPKDSRVEFSSFYVPHDMIGGDYFSIRQLDADHYAFFLADVMGHGVSAGLYTMHLSSLWERHCHKLMQPAIFAETLNKELCKIVKDESFATAVCGVLNAADKTIRFASAGSPPIALLHIDGSSEQIEIPGVPFGMFDRADYEEVEFNCVSGDRLLMFTDGVIEVENADKEMLNTSGLIDILRHLDYPNTDIQIDSLQRALLNYSNTIRLDDDLTLLEIRFF